MTISRKKFIWFAITAIALSLIFGVFLLFAADLILHRRAEKSAGLNRYGYRGPVVGGKERNELRVVMLGGSTVFGYGVAWDESIPVYLEAALKPVTNRPVRVVNLGFNNEGAYAFVPNLEDFAYLDYDVIVLYEGYNDLPGDESPNYNVYRRDSAVYRLTGYFPILPLYLTEKAMTLRAPSLDAAYDDLRAKSAGKPAADDKVVFQPGLAQRTSAAAIEAVAAMTRALDGQLERTATAVPPVSASASSLGCQFPYVTYCESVAAAIRYGRANGKGVVVGAQPHLPGARSQELHARQRHMLGAMIARVFGGDKRVAWADLSALVDLTDVDNTFDAMHLKPDANRRVAASFAPYVAAVAAQ